MSATGDMKNLDSIDVLMNDKRIIRHSHVLYEHPEGAENLSNEFVMAQSPLEEGQYINPSES